MHHSCAWQKRPARNCCSGRLPPEAPPLALRHPRRRPWNDAGKAEQRATMRNGQWFERGRWGPPEPAGGRNGSRHISGHAQSAPETQLHTACAWEREDKDLWAGREMLTHLTHSIPYSLFKLPSVDSTLALGPSAPARARTCFLVCLGRKNIRLPASAALGAERACTVACPRCCCAPDNALIRRHGRACAEGPSTDAMTKTELLNHVQVIQRMLLRLLWSRCEREATLQPPERARGVSSPQRGFPE